MRSDASDPRAGPAVEDDGREPDPEERAGSDGSRAGDRLAEIVELLRGALADLAEMRAAGLRLAKLRADRAKLALRRTLFLAAMLAIVGLAAAVALGAAAVLLVSGLAGALNALFESRVWVGELAAGAIVLLGALAAVAWLRRASLRAFARELERKYEGGGEPRS